MKELYQAQRSDKDKRQVRRYVKKVGHTQKHALICKSVVTYVLREGRQTEINA
jgi:hypothetical protein